MGDHWINALLFSVFSVLSASQLVHSTDMVYPPLTTPANATAEGAVCLDGSPPAYQLAKGYGDGANDWTIHIEGGGWCNNDTDCLHKIDTGMGGGKKMDPNKTYGGIQNPDKSLNPYFYNWNKVYVRYCDGASFMADVKEPKVVNNRTLYFRGARIFKAIVEDLLEKGMKDANNVLLSGDSAGGLANLFNCDNFRALVPNNINISRVKCLADCSFFLHGKDLPGLELREGPVFSIVETHGLAKRLPKSCTSKMDPRLCMFPEYFVGDIQTPLFMVQSAYDSFQILNRTKLEMSAADCLLCYGNISLCAPAELKAMKDFATTLVEALPRNSSSRGLFVDSCSIHGRILDDNKWHNVPEPTLHNKTVAQAVADWFFDQSSFQVIKKTDFPYFCNYPALNQNNG